MNIHKLSLARAALAVAVAVIMLSLLVIAWLAIGRLLFKNTLGAEASAEFTEFEFTGKEKGEKNKTVHHGVP